jgi:GntR family transcriptional regulator
LTTRRRPQPLRYQIKDDLLDLFNQQKFKPGDKIPPESALMETLQVSRSTLREGLQLLEEEHVIRTRHGIGRYLVSNPIDYKYDIARWQSATEMLTEYGLHPNSKIMEIVEIPADPQIASRLGIEPGALVLDLKRIWYAGDIPVICSIDIVPRSYLSQDCDFVEMQGSLTKFLSDNCDIHLDHALSTVKAIVTDPFLKSVGLDNALVPWIVLEQVNYDQHNRAVIYSRDYHHSEYITFHVLRYRS